MRSKKTDFNLEEIKVRWKKASLENCTGLPCNNPAAPGSPTGVKAVDGNGQATVSFTVPASDGGRPITSYTVTSNPGGITGTGSGSPIIVSGLTNGTNYTFTVVATNVIGNSSPSSASTAVTPFLCVSNTVKDFDGNTYNTVLIGTQCWTKKNLKVTKYNDGSDIPLDATGGSNGNTGVENWSSLSTGARTVHSNNNSNIASYGFLYNGYAAKGIATVGSTTFKNVCPIGWHVPTNSEWTILTDHIGGEAGFAGKLKSTDINYWDVITPGTDNSTGFSALGGSYRRANGSFADIKKEGVFWTSTENGSNLWWRNVSIFWDNITVSSLPLVWGKSIRCLKD